MTTITLNDGSLMLIDDEDLDFAKSKVWVNTRGHAVFSTNGKSTYFAREIMNAQQGYDIDHINHDTLDNQKANLRLVTRSQNLANRGKTKANTTGYKGVFVNGNNYMARLAFEGKKYFLGTFKTKELAARAYDKKAKEIHGEFAHLNFPDE